VTLTVTDTAGQKSTDTLKVIVSGSATAVTYSPVYENRRVNISYKCTFHNNLSWCRKEHIYLQGCNAVWSEQL
jgi:hypothetical protein